MFCGIPIEIFVFLLKPTTFYAVIVLIYIENGGYSFARSRRSSKRVFLDIACRPPSPAGILNQINADYRW